MHEITGTENIDAIKTSSAVVILFGGKQCAVCHSLRPRLEAMLQSQYPDVSSVYIDCEVSPGICAQHGVFSLPVVQFYIEGMKVCEFARSFSVEQLQQSMQRTYTMWHESR